MSNNGNHAHKRKAEEENRTDHGKYTSLHSHYDSRIVRVSRSSGGKDRHSKVLTAKGLRDRRVRLSVSTAIQFYDLQDRLGFDQPSKALEWLIKAASKAIDQLPALQIPPHSTASALPPVSPNGTADSSSAAPNICRKSPSDVPGSSSPEDSHESSKDPSAERLKENPVILHRSSSSNSDGSKGTHDTCSAALSLSRSDSRMKARERAKERAARGKAIQDSPKETENLSFTDLLQSMVSTDSQNRSHNPETEDFAMLRNRLTDLGKRGRYERPEQQHNFSVNSVDFLSTSVADNHSSHTYPFPSSAPLLSPMSTLPINSRLSSVSLMENPFAFVGNTVMHDTCSTLATEVQAELIPPNTSEQMLSLSAKGLISGRETLQSNSYSIMNYYMQSQHQTLLQKLNQVINGAQLHGYDELRIMERHIHDFGTHGSNSGTDPLVSKSDSKPQHQHPYS
eukprot:TRINITY_DN9676_c0_g1_i1.p1 TRINITY_DN9676_c0_g1~~TRINITY_DN9676_c0_g1_i1.p1  ORF type:complete len:453 (+),score=47.68 TRINITY_DN9676_c0_g1_i1:862-2220(+)